MFETKEKILWTVVGVGITAIAGLGINLHMKAQYQKGQFDKTKEIFEMLHKLESDLENNRYVFKETES